MINTYKMEDHEVPTFYYAIKHQPKMVNGIVDIDPEFSMLTRETMINKLNDKNQGDIKKEDSKEIFL